MTEAPVKEVAAALNARIADLARTLHGEPNRDLSSKQQLRFGTHGSLAVEIAGDNAGRWFDHEARQGGDGLEMVKQGRGLANGAALDWARQWLGWPQGRKPRRKASAPSPEGAPMPEEAPPHIDAFPSDAIPLEAIEASARSKSAKKTAEDAKRAAKVAEIIAGCEDPHGSCVETYLQRRGITATPLPPSIRYLANAYSQYGALVALATDAAGEVHGLQQIYLTEDGRKAPLKVQKRTNKAHDRWSDVATVRLPGPAPIILCEGVETALSVWQATGQECWACLGISNIARAPLPEGAAVIIARDGDEPNSKADQQLRQAIAILRSQGHDVTVAEPPPGTDFNDVLQSDGADAVRMLLATTLPAAAFSDEWRKDLLRNEDGEPRPVLANAITALRAAPEWNDVLWHDAFATTTVARKPPPWIDRTTEWADTPWADRDDALVANWLQHQEIMVPMSIAGQAVEVVARDRLFHPVRDHLDALAWDGTPRLDTWLLRYLGAEDTPYHRAIGPRWMMSAIARIYIPGCKADCALILEGPQGIRKSSALMAIAKPSFADRLSDLSSKDAAMETRGVWVIEIAELDTMGRAEVSTIKAFMSRTQDRFRPPYGKRLVDLPRQCVFAGSVNPEGGYLKDPTGGRRFWPVVCGSIEISALEQDRDQLWAEARDRFRRNEPWWLETQALDGLAAEEQAERYQGSLIKNNLLTEINAPREHVGLGWRQDDDGTWIVARITDEGLRAVGIDPNEGDAVTGEPDCSGIEGSVPDTAPSGAEESAQEGEDAPPPEAAQAAPLAEEIALLDQALAARTTTLRTSLRDTAAAILAAWDDEANREGDMIGALHAPMEALRTQLAGKPAPTSREPGAPRKPREGTKQEQVLAMLRRPEGATVAQIAEATGWTQHTVRGFFAGLKKKGHSIEVRERIRQVGPNKTGAKGSFTIYRIA